MLALACQGAGAPSSSTPSAVAAPVASSAGATSSATARGAPGPLRLVVLLVVDQLPSWSFERDRPLMRQGIRRLLDQGALWTHASYPYAATNTAPGHAAIATGAPPAITGITTNRPVDRRTGKPTEIDLDPGFPVFDVMTGDELPRDGVSNQALRAPGIAEALHSRPGARAVAISLKSRSAAFVLGQRPDVALWFDSTKRAMTTSKAFAVTPPAWLKALATSEPAAPLLAALWKPSPAVDFAGHTGRGDDGAGEGDADGLGKTFDHDLGRTKDPAKAFVATPMASTLLVETALAALAGEALGADEVPDVLAISFSAHDYAGHAWGQESWERLDHLLRLDEEIGRLLAALDERVGVDRYAVVLTSDHGATPIVEDSLAAGRDAHRVPTSLVKKTAETAAAAALVGEGAGPWVLGVSDVDIVMSPAFAALAPEARGRGLDAVIAAVRELPGIGFAGRTEFTTGCDAQPELEARICRSVYPGRSGEVYYAAARYSFIGDGLATSHGAPNPEEREVPLIVLAPGVAHAVSDERVSMLRVAPTVARLLGVAPPERATEASLVP